MGFTSTESRVQPEDQQARLSPPQEKKSTLKEGVSCSTLSAKCLPDYEQLRQLLRANPSQAKGVLPNGHVPLIDAVLMKNDRVKSVKLLLEHRADVNFTLPTHRVYAAKGATALHFAAFKDVKLVSILLDAQADPKLRDRHGNTPLAYVDVGTNAMLLLNAASNATEVGLATLISRGGEVATEALRGMMEEQTNESINDVGEVFIGSSPNTSLVPEEEPDPPGDYGKSVLLQMWPDLFFSFERVRPRIMKCTTKGVATLEIIKALAQAQSSDVLDTDFAFAVVTHVWNNIFGMYFAMNALNAWVSLFLVVLLSRDVRTDGVANTYHLAALTCTIFLSIIQELIELTVILVQVIQILNRGLKSMLGLSLKSERTSIGHLSLDLVHSVWNAVGGFNLFYDWGSILISGFGVITFYNWDAGCDDACMISQKTRASMFAVMWWARAVYYLRGFACIGPGVLCILSALKKSVAFCVVTACTVCAFTHAFYIVGTRADKGVPLIYASFLPIFRLALLGDFDLFELQGQDTIYEHVVGDDLEHASSGDWEPVDPTLTQTGWLVHIIFFATSTLMNVFMMTLLTGILSKNYDEAVLVSRPEFLRERASIITAYSSHPWVSAMLRIQGFITRVESDYLWATFKPEKSDETAELGNMIRKKLGKHCQKLSLHERLDDLEKKVLDPMICEVKQISKTLQNAAARKHGARVRY